MVNTTRIPITANIREILILACYENMLHLETTQFSHGKSSDLRGYAVYCV